jgi:hypothetical protein
MTAIRFSNLPVADRGRSWNGDAADKRDTAPWQGKKAA